MIVLDWFGEMFFIIVLGESDKVMFVVVVEFVKIIVFVILDWKFVVFIMRL